MGSSSCARGCWGRGGVLEAGGFAVGDMIAAPGDVFRDTGGGCATVVGVTADGAAGWGRGAGAR